MTEVQKELFDEFGKKKKKGGLFVKSPSERKVSWSFSFDGILLALLLLLMCVVIIYATGVEIGQKARASLVKSQPEKKIEPSPAVTPKKALIIQTMTPTPAKRFTIQIASHHEKGTADHEVSRLQKEGLSVFMTPNRNGFALCVGTYATRSEADRALETIRKRYKDCFVRNL